MGNSIGDKHVCLWRAPKKNCMERLKHKLEEIQYQATVNIPRYAVLITWPRYNNMDYSYPRSSK